MVSRALEMVYTCIKAQTTFQVTIKLMITVHVVLCTCDMATPHKSLFVMVGEKMFISVHVQCYFCLLFSEISLGTLKN